MTHTPKRRGTRDMSLTDRINPRTIPKQTWPDTRRGGPGERVTTDLKRPGGEFGTHPGGHRTSDTRHPES